MAEVAAKSSASPFIPGPRQPVRRTEREFTVRERSQTVQILRRFLRHRAAVVSVVVFLFLVLLAFVGPELWKYSYTDISSPGGSPPTLDNPFGTDNIGHDNFARVLRGMQQSLKVGFSVMILATGIGAPYGAISGLLGGWVDYLMMRVCDVLLVLPLLAVAAAIGFGVGGTIVVISLVLGLLGWSVMARIVRGVVLSLREQEFIEAARAMGAGTLRIVFRHLLPNVIGTIIVQATLDIAGAILVESALSFLGLGVQPPDTSLGALTNLARPSVDTQWWLFYAPGVMIILIALTINFIGDGLRDAFDPRQTRQRR
jgi:peptide/nickel transport system permease protein